MTPEVDTTQVTSTTVEGGTTMSSIVPANGVIIPPTTIVCLPSSNPAPLPPPLPPPPVPTPVTHIANVVPAISSSSVLPYIALTTSTPVKAVPTKTQAKVSAIFSFQ